MLRRLAAPLTLGACLFVPSLALADVPPPPGYVEKCTVKKAERRTSNHCESCDAWHGDMDACVNKYAGTTFKKDCQTRGASVWDEVWCDPQQPRKGGKSKQAEQPDKAANEPSDDGGSGSVETDKGQRGAGCSVAASDGGLVGGLASGLALLALFGLRRRRD